MSDHHNETHADPIKLSAKNITFIVVVCLFITIAIISGLNGALSSTSTPTLDDQQATADRIQKVGSVVISAQSSSGEPKTGEQVYTTVCASCHGSGNMNSPKFGDAAEWGPRVAKGFNALLDSALHGKGKMPARGGSSLSDLEVARGVVYMANHGGAHFPEPKDTK
jgi:cytochrome c5